MGDSFSTVGDTFSGGITSVQWGHSFSTVEGIQYIGRKHQYMRGDNISTVGG